ncbi:MULTISPECIES: alpha/beta hydrolase [unclassified Kribbella]|uniref:alpha/beta hydrolase n=1 Tax=unclassified Kribbella TaxID=2644121 RepID=UPI00301AD308
MPSKESEAVKRHWAAARLTSQLPMAEQPDRETADHTWAGLTSEPRDVDYLSVGEVSALWIVPKDAVPDRVLLCMHGGGFVGGSIHSHRKMFGHLAKAVGARALVFDYRLVPEHTYPAQLDDAIAVYRWLLDQGIDPARIVFAGDSVGGGLAITTQLRARSDGLPLPAASLLFSPCVDMELTGDSYDANRDRDAFFHRELVRELVAMYVGPGGDLRDPLVNPLYGDLTGFGPTYIQAGGDEALVDDARMLYELARKAGVEARLDVFPDMQHTFQMAAGRVPEADDAIQRMAAWVRPLLGLPRWEA